MIITGYKLGRLRAPLITPFRTALREVGAVEDIILTLETDGGLFGYGSAPATAVITGDTHGSIIETIRLHLMPRLLGGRIEDLFLLCQAIRTAVVHNSNAKAAVEMALFDLWAQQLGVPLCRALGGAPTTLHTDLTISLNSIEQMLLDVDTALARGFMALKIKLGTDLDTDLERVRLIHARVSGRAALRLDANQSWTARQTVSLLNALERSGIVPELIEQPVPAHDLAGMKFVRERVATPVMADESVFDVPQLLRLLEMQAADIVNIKLMKSGGISGALRLADLCAEHGLECQIGCMLESALGVAAAAHVAAARPKLITRVDLDAAALCQHTGLQMGTVFADSTIEIGLHPGLGVIGFENLEPVT